MLKKITENIKNKIFGNKKVYKAARYLRYLCYVRRQKKVYKKICLIAKENKRKLKIAWLVNENEKGCCESVYSELIQSEYFERVIC
jgi:hypothetical protein